ncbi:MAG: ATP-binding cassette domain-containing protein [Oscillospiraceae bacterium]
MDNETLIEVENLSHLFRLSKTAVVKAVHRVSFTVNKGEIFGLVGESGSGKSTLARCIMNIYSPTSGKVTYNGIETTDKRQFRENKKALQKDRQIIFQDSNSSLNQRMSVRDILSEPLNIHHICMNRREREELLRFNMKYVGLEPRYLDLYPPEISGGQRQRVSIARALLMEPQLIVADEPVASLDVSIQAQIINLFKHLQQEHGFTFMFIAHDLAMVEFICDRVGVMYHGHLVELAKTKDLFSNPCHPYTKALLSAIPIPDPRLERGRKPIVFDEQHNEHDYDFTELENGHFVMMKKEGVQ